MAATSSGTRDDLMRISTASLAALHTSEAVVLSEHVSCAMSYK